MPRSIWNGVITFGMVSIPVKLYTATENRDIAFHQLHNVCDTRIKYQKHCPHCDRNIENDEIEKGYEYARGQYIILTEDDFEQLPLRSKHAIQVSAFVKAEEIDPIYYEKSYFVEPDEAAIRPFTLFMSALQDKNVVAVASITLRNKERLCALRPMGGTLLVDTLLYPDEVRVGEETDTPKAKVNEKELQMAERLIELMQQDFDPSQYNDHYREALKKLIEAKLEGKEIAVPEAPRARVIDLMDALRASVASIQQEGKPSLKKADKAASKAVKNAAEEEAQDTGKRKTAARTKSPEKRSTSARPRKRKKSA